MQIEHERREKEEQILIGRRQATERRNVLEEHLSWSTSLGPQI